MTAGVIDAGIDATVYGVDPRAERAPRIAGVDVTSDRAVLVPEQRRRKIGLERGPLHRQIDDAGRRRESVVQSGCSLEYLDTILVLERQVDQVDNGQRAVQSVVGSVLHVDATNGDVAVDGRP